MRSEAWALALPHIALHERVPALVVHLEDLTAYPGGGVTLLVLLVQVGLERAGYVVLERVELRRALGPRGRRLGREVLHLQVLPHRLSVMAGHPGDLGDIAPLRHGLRISSMRGMSRAILSVVLPSQELGHPCQGSYDVSGDGHAAPP